MNAFEKPLVTISGQKKLFKLSLHEKILQDLPQEGIEWRRRLDSNSKPVYIDVDFVDFDVDSVGRSENKHLRQEAKVLNISESNKNIVNEKTPEELENIKNQDKIEFTIESTQIEQNSNSNEVEEKSNDTSEILTSLVFFNTKLLGKPILHTYWADKSDFENENQKAQFDEWIGKVQASACTEWAIIIIEDGDFRAQLGTAIFKSKLQSSANQSSAPPSSLPTMSQLSSSSFMDRLKTGLSTIFQSDSNSDRWLTLVNQDKLPDNKAQDSYDNFIKKLRNVILTAFSKQIELLEEKLRIQREQRHHKNWNFLTYFTMQEELAFSFEFLTLFDEALVQYDLLDALFTEYIASPAFDNSLHSQWTTFTKWHTLCLDTNSEHSKELRNRILDKKASLLDMRNYLFAKQCDLILLQNQPWKVAASASKFLQSSILEHQQLNIKTVVGSLTCWVFTSALEILQKCECYSCTSTMENYSFHTVDTWNYCRKKLFELGQICNLLPGLNFSHQDKEHVKLLLEGLGTDPHHGRSVSNEGGNVGPQARLKDALANKENFSKHYIEISELTLGTYKHIGRKRHALQVGRELADFYLIHSKYSKALPFLIDLERSLKNEKWDLLIEDVCNCIIKCQKSINGNG